MALRISERTEESARVGVGFLCPGGLASWSAIKAAVDVATGLAKMVDLIYPERFRIVNLDEDVNRLIRHSAEVFGARAETLRGEPPDSAHARPE